MVADIIPATKTDIGQGFFSYLVPPEFSDKVRAGSIVKIPFGKQIIRGIVLGLKEKNESGFKLKTIKEIEDDYLIPEAYLSVITWISKYYLCSLGQSASLFLPPQLKRPKVVKTILNSEKLPQTVLTPEQNSIFCSLRAKLSIANPKPSLLFGVTGSGKTEIYINLTREVLNNHKQVVVLVPEIILTTQTIEKFQSFFSDQIVLMHSNLSKSEKYYCYDQFATGKKSIIIGPRSALSVPSSKIGLIIIDEEQEDSYKQEQAPRYHAVTLAEKIAKETGALLLLGSATPRIETYFKTTTGEFDLHFLKNRYGKESLPKAEIVDLKNEMRGGNYSPISITLQKNICSVLERKRQAILFLNRRGTATFVSCRECGHIILCRNCSVPMVYHVNSSQNFLNCHQCNSRQEIPSLCPNCQSPKIKFFGAGVEKIFTEIKNFFPKAKSVQIDAISMSKKEDYANFYHNFKKGQIDLAVGTQILAKGLDIPNVDLVGIISADVGLHLPNFRASEKTFQMLTQVSGRSGRKESEGKTIIQTYWPDNLAIIAASLHDYQKFYNYEIVERERFKYPPYCKLIRIISEFASSEKASNEINKISQTLKKLNYVITGPAPAFYNKLHNKYRYHLIIKISGEEHNIYKLVQDNPQLIWDVEPVNLL